ncbi:subtilisin-like protein [Wilcoxina mikolae CBS 423.85]|nr:subtilisin-like protein [Wilcoxina mikolae CBS 423.85]
MVNFNIRFLLFAAAAILPFAAALPVHAVTSDPGTVTIQSGSVVADHYIVLLKPETTAEEFQAHQVWATNLHHRRLSRRDDSSLAGIKRKWHFGKMTGYSGSFDNATIEEIKARSDVELVEEDKVVVALGIESQPNAPWGIARVSQGKTFSDSTYRFDSSAGSGVTVYVIDTGINAAHQDFEGRAKFAHNAVGGADEDGQGHGTHVAGTIAGKTFGIAKKAEIRAVKVLGDNGQGTNSGVIAGVQWVAKDAKGKNGKAVANMSLGGVFSQAVNRAVEAAIESGVTFCVAAGNEGVDAANSSPASVESAITVGATDRTDTRAQFSNFGKLVDVFAPGVDITSAWIGSDTAENTISGTSMASPHVAGLAAYLIALEGLSGPAEVAKRMKELAVGVVSDPGADTTDSLIFNGVGGERNGTFVRRWSKEFKH